MFLFIVFFFLFLTHESLPTVPAIAIIYIYSEIKSGFFFFTFSIHPTTPATSIPSSPESTNDA
ncbi:hypothetical protein IscW_ISCW011962 [Ixodes scapularis]|uniref:Secreted protein n=1 Tax=Ixodes scapularis TaxID=6945 RepID=B7QDU1_IXOSC|nr:hypothetical protein IscW_ISCW011962 [Ixodes scapularis]|eukprot:XP_002413705.1 hypothetical protein IscW_ISCW011962 [Ixodes scapularis]